MRRAQIAPEEPSVRELVAVVIKGQQEMAKALGALAGKLMELDDALKLMLGLMRQIKAGMERRGAL